MHPLIMANIDKRKFHLRGRHLCAFFVLHDSFSQPEIPTESNQTWRNLLFVIKTNMLILNKNSCTHNGCVDEAIVGQNEIINREL